MTQKDEIIPEHISKHCPAIYKPHIGEFSKALSDEENIALVGVCLRALAAVAKWNETCAPSDK
jgi:sister chromatid cohesion protein PDS5